MVTVVSTSTGYVHPISPYIGLVIYEIFVLLSKRVLSKIYFQLSTTDAPGQCDISLRNAFSHNWKLLVSACFSC